MAKLNMIELSTDKLLLCLKIIAERSHSSEEKLYVFIVEVWDHTCLAAITVRTYPFQLDGGQNLPGKIQNNAIILNRIRCEFIFNSIKIEINHLDRYRDVEREGARVI